LGCAAQRQQKDKTMTFDIAVMQLFNGISLFTILVLMALGLAIVFGLMGVINMAHGELMALGAYVTYMTAHFFERNLPSLMGIYIFFAILLAFLATFVFGWILERGFIRFLYQRPLDTLLATWGLSLVLQQAYRSIFGAQEVSVPMTSWLTGAWNATEGIQIPLNRMFIVGLTLIVSAGVYLFLYKTRWGLRIRAVTQNRTMSGAAGINTNRVDALTFAVGSGLAGIAGAVFTMLGSTNPLTGQLYIVDSFIVVVFGGVASLLGTFVSGFAIAQTQTTLEFLLSGSMAKVAILLFVVVVLYFRPNGLFASKVRH
jgi:urea transport system permease protein